MTIELDVFLEGYQEPIGVIVGDEITNNLEFKYSDAYLEREDNVQLSLSLPIQEKEYKDSECKSYFTNLIQENNSLETLIDQLGIDRNNTAGILYHIGADCAGAVSCVPKGSPAPKRPGDLRTDYDVIEKDQIVKIIHELSEYGRLPDGTRDPSPVAGVQPKLACVYTGGVFLQPKPGLGVPTTHLLKVVKRGSILTSKHESIALNVAKSVGLEIPDFVEGDFSGAISTILLERYDRTFDGSTISRIHQEDFAQALGLPPRLKYERNGVIGRRFDARSIVRILKETTAPAISMRKFIKATFVNLALGNVDNHGKNHALLYRKPGYPTLAPFYDIVPTRLDKRYADQFSFNIGSAERIDNLTPEDVAEFLGQFGLKASQSKAILKNEVKPAIASISEQIEHVAADGHKLLADLIAQNTSYICNILEWGDIKIPVRDLFAHDVGGWID